MNKAKIVECRNNAVEFLTVFYIQHSDNIAMTSRVSYVYCENLGENRVRYNDTALYVYFVARICVQFLLNSSSSS